MIILWTTYLTRQNQMMTISAIFGNAGYSEEVVMIAEEIIFRRRMGIIQPQRPPVFVPIPIGNRQIIIPIRRR